LDIWGTYGKFHMVSEMRWLGSLMMNSVFDYLAITFIRFKEMVTTAPVLRYFDTKKLVTIQFDSSRFGLGATLLQEG
jgi:hypothetical protein